MFKRSAVPTRQVDLGTYDIKSSTGSTVGRMYVVPGDTPTGTIEYWCLYSAFERPRMHGGAVTFVLSPFTGTLPFAENATRAEVEDAAQELARSQGVALIKAVCDEM